MHSRAPVPRKLPRNSSMHSGRGGSSSLSSWRRTKMSLILAISAFAILAVVLTGS